MTSTERSGGLTSTELESLRATLIEVRAANLADLEAARSTVAVLADDGTYGTCVDCHQQIPLARLELRPYGVRCVVCAS